MTEAEWSTCTDAKAMLDAVSVCGSLVSNRKVRLLAVACVRHVGHLLFDERSREVIECVERYVDGQSNEAALTRLGTLLGLLLAN